jgi:EmrB/QacA subfamily drug resistance transporter
LEYKWKAFSVTSIGAMMAAIDSTIVILALFPIAADLDSNFVTMVWVVIAYLLTNTALVLSLGRIADIYGRKKMYNIGFVVFTIGSVLSGLAPNGDLLVAFRGLQGVGAALLTANSFAILSEAFPPRERGKAFGASAVLWGVGSTIGIVLGGVIIAYTTWRWIFLINLPVGVFATFWAYRTLREVKNPGAKQSFDLPAAFLFTASLFSLVFGVTWGLLYSWEQATTYVSFVGAGVFFAAFLVWEQRFSKSPIIEFSMFRNRGFSFPLLSAFLQSLALFSVNFLLIFYLEGIGGFSVLTAAYLLVPVAIATAITGPFAGILSDRIGSRFVASSGLAIQAMVLLVLSRLTTSTPLVDIAMAEAFYGMGAGLFFPANTSAIMSASPPGKYGVSSGVMNTFRNTGMVLSFALSLTAATSMIPSSVVYKLFVGNIGGKLSPTYANGYLTGQGFAFGLSALFLLLSLAFTLARRNPPPGPVWSGPPPRKDGPPAPPPHTPAP